MWSRNYKACQECGLTEKKHAGKGLCKRCAGRKWYRNKMGYQPAGSGWSMRYEQCVKCGTTKIKYESKGMCSHCYSKYRYTKPEYLKYKRDYARKRSKEDINWRLSYNLRCRLRFALKNNSKKSKTLDYLGCSIKQLKQHLEQQFQSGMTWENYGIYGWHIDHIIPISHFDLSKEEEIYKACHFSNLQPLWAKENWSKQNGKKRKDNRLCSGVGACSE